MSLIQQALEKTDRVKGARAAAPAQSPKTWERDPMGAVLERQLTEVQEKYAQRRSLYLSISLGVLLVGFVAGLSYVGMRQKPSSGNPSPVKIASVKSLPVKPLPAVVAAPVAPPIPLTNDFRNSYHLTGITDLSGKAIAVINGRLVGVGDVLDGKAVVRAIGNGEVRLEAQGKEIRLVL